MTRRPAVRTSAAEKRRRDEARFDAGLTAAGWAAKYGPQAPTSEPRAGAK